MPADGMEGLQGAQEVSSLAGLCRCHTDKMENLLPAQIFGSCEDSSSVERVQGEETLRSDMQERDAASGHQQGVPGSTQVGGMMLNHICM